MGDSAELIELPYVEECAPYREPSDPHGRLQHLRREVRAFAPDTPITNVIASGYHLQCPRLQLVSGNIANYDLAHPLTIAMQQSLDEYVEAFASFHGITDQLDPSPFKPIAATLPARGTESSLNGGDKVCIGGVTVSLKRTLRVPDTNKIYALPCDAGTLPLTPVPSDGPMLDVLPASIRERRVARGRGIDSEAVQRRADDVHATARGHVDQLQLLRRLRDQGLGRRRERHLRPAYVAEVTRRPAGL